MPRRKAKAASAARKGTKKRKNDPSCPSKSTIQEVDEPIIKSPLDTHGYRMVQLEDNGLQGLLISTCLHPVDLSDDGPKSRGKGKPLDKCKCTFRKIEQFNETYANFKMKTDSQDKPGGGRKGASSSVTFNKASETEEKKAKARRGLAAKEKWKKVRKVKCRKGVHEIDDEMQNFCNNKYNVVVFIKAGFFQDPIEVPGMAHFCEHVITLGSENFPEIEALSKFVESEGGWYNARTDYEYTALYFYVDHEFVVEPLKMLADVLSYPVFHEDYIFKEIDNINSEFEAKRGVDEIRQMTLYQHCVKDGHPASNFGTGSKESLTQDKKTVGIKTIMNQLKEWMGRYYCTQNMIFAIQGPSSLDDLENLFSEHFSSVPKTFGNLPCSVCPFPKEKDKKFNDLPPMNPKKWNRMYHMVASGDNLFMTVTWVLDPKFGLNFETKPITYFSYILTKKEPGSLDWYLRQRGWLTMLSINHPHQNFFVTDFYTMFSIYLELTEEGFENRLKVLEAIFSYVNLLRKKKASEEIFNEVRQLHSDLFHYRSDLNLNDPTVGKKFDEMFVSETLFELLHTISKTGRPSRVLLDTFLTTKYDSKLLNDFVEFLTPANAMILFASASFEKRAKEETKWFNVQFYSTSFCDTLKANLEQIAPYKEFCFPKPNPFIYISCCAPQANLKDKIEGRVGLEIYDSPKGHVEYGNDRCRKCMLPSAEYTIVIRSPGLENSTDWIAVPSEAILAMVMKAVLEIKLGQALSSLISVDVFEIENGITVQLAGPSSKLPELAKTILKTLHDFRQEVKLKPKIVLNRINNLVGFYKSCMVKSQTCAESLISYILNQKAHFLSDYVEVLENYYNRETFQLFVDDFCSRLFIEADLNGCVTRSQACEVAQFLEELNIIPYQRKVEHEQYERTIKIPVGERCLLVSAKDKEDRNVAVLNYYQVVIKDKVYRIMFNAIAACLGATAFEELRVKEGLGYFVDVEIGSFNGIDSIIVFVQGTADNHSTGFIDERIDVYLENMFALSFKNKKSFDYHIMEWVDPNIELKLKEVKDFFQDHFLSNGCEFRKLSIQIQGYKKSSKSTPEQPTLVEEKKERYSSGKKLTPCGTGNDGGSCGISTLSKYLDLCLKNVEEENGYFITDILKFKNEQVCYGFDDYYDSEDDDV